MIHHGWILSNLYQAFRQVTADPLHGYKFIVVARSHTFVIGQAVSPDVSVSACRQITMFLLRTG